MYLDMDSRLFKTTIPEREVEIALKLQKLIKKMIKSNGKDLKQRQKSRNYQGWCAESIIDEALKSLVEESEK